VLINVSLLITSINWLTVLFAISAKWRHVAAAVSEPVIYASAWMCKRHRKCKNTCPQFLISFPVIFTKMSDSRYEMSFDSRLGCSITGLYCNQKSCFLHLSYLKLPLEKPNFKWICAEVMMVLHFHRIVG